MKEACIHHEKIRRQGYLYLQKPESVRLASALSRIPELKETVLSQNTNDSEVEMSDKLTSPDDGEFQLLQIQPQNPLLQELSKKISSGEKEAIDKYMSGGGKMILLKRTKTSQKFHRTLDQHSEKFHGGFAPVTEIVFTLRLLHCREPLKMQNNSEETVSYQSLREMSETSLFFIPVSEENDSLSSAVASLNTSADPYEFLHDVFLAQKEIGNSESILALFSTGLGFLTPTFLEHVVKDPSFALGANILSQHKAEQFAEGATMMSAHGIGEIIAMMTARADTLKNNLPKIHFKHVEKSTLNLKRLTNSLKIPAVAFTRIPQQTKLWLVDKVNGLKNINEEQKTDVKTVFLALGIIGLGSILSSMTGSMLPFLAVSPVNTGIIAGREILRRAKHITKEFPELSNDGQDIKQYLAQKYKHRLPKTIIEKRPDLALAMVDYASNKPAFFGFMGTVASLGLAAVPASDEATRQQIYAASAIIFEQIASFLGGATNKLSNPYKKLLKVMEIENRMSQHN